VTAAGLEGDSDRARKGGLHDLQVAAKQLPENPEFVNLKACGSV
jgi:hypothetical protein